MESTSQVETAATRLRDEIGVSERYAYFDHAAVAPITNSAAASMIQYAEEARMHGDAIWLEWAARIEQLRSLAAGLLAAETEEIALLSNTTQGINLVAEGFPWKPGDNLLVPENEFPSNLLPWENLSRFGVEIRRVSPREDEAITVDQLAPFVDQRTRLITFSWVGYASGYRANVAELVEFAHERGILVFLDAIQGLGAFPLDVAACGPDFVAADGHKWMLGPEGAGILYIKREHLELLQPLGLGWNSLSQGAFDPLPIKMKAAAGRYEGGTMNMSGLQGLRSSLGVLLECGLNASPPSLAAAILENVGLLEQELLRAGFEVLLPGEAEHRSGIVGVLWEGAKADAQQLIAARKALLSQDVVTSVRQERLRISTHAYNNAADIRRLVEGLTEFRDSPRE